MNKELPMESKKVTKAELVSAIAEKSGATKAAVSDVLAAEKEVIQEMVANGNTVTLPSHLTFSPVEKAARKGHNPQTGEPIDIPAKVAVKVRPSSVFQELVNSKSSKK